MCYKKFSSSYSIAAPSISMCTQLYIDSYPKSLAHIRKDNSLMNTIFFWITTNNIYPQTGIVQHFTSCILWFKIHSKLKFKNIWNNTALVYTFKFSHFKKMRDIKCILAQGAPWEPPNIKGFCQGYWLPSTTWWQGPIAGDNTFLCHWTQRSQSGA